MQGVNHEVDLPEGWVAAFDPTYKRMYYYDTKRRKSTWTKPPRKDDYVDDVEDKPEGSYASSVSTSADEASELQEGYYMRAPEKLKSTRAAQVPGSSKAASKKIDNSWVELYSKEHERKYFYNRVTKESVWKDPYLLEEEKMRRAWFQKRETPSASRDKVLEDVPALHTAWNQIEKAREDIKREREEINGRLRTDAKLLKACLEEFARLRKDYAFTPDNIPSEEAEGVEGLFTEKHPEEADAEEGQNILDSLRSELDRYSRDIESRAAEMSRAHSQSRDGQQSVQEESSESEEDSEDMTPEERKARHRRRMAKKRERQGPGSLVLHMDMEEEIKGVVAEMKAREQAKAEARQVKEGDYYRVLGLKKTAKPGDLKRAYHKLMIKWHPDKNPDNIKEATQNSNLVTDAYTVLSDPWERQIYDHLGLEHYLIHAKTLQAFKNYMWSGIRIKKHGRNGKRYGIRGMISFYPAKRRYLWLDFHCKSINTGPARILEAQTDKEKDSIKSVSMSSITEVKKGMKTEVFLRTGTLSRQQHYLSIISPERTLDIETETIEQRNFLATRISLLVFDLQRNKEKLFNHYKENPIKKKKKKKRFNNGRRRF